MNKNTKVALIIGANRGIGFGLVKNLLQDKANYMIYASYRSEDKSQDLLSLAQEYPEKLKCLVFDAIKSNNYSYLLDSIVSETEKIDLCINCIGVLDDGVTFPERKVEELSSESLSHCFTLNTIPTLLLAKTLKSLLLKSESPKFVAISAKVGSISDNRLGGWYAYRISKAALNMAIKNLSIEFKRLHKNSMIVAIHPGTTQTELSKAFIKHAAKSYIVHQPEQAGKNILQLINRLSPNETGLFFSWDGSKISW
ncbi:MAG TPA: SDR family NAD(P)-dependent oxidoreductase [Oligoflexia bacterium]|nr:SDR family NAD(P)-dependent oxidoreductase [Oligoflexia bacterium]HMR24229.1 SDR family NAD(P)-dependent oxidoreductase [Oligoflexia bacterium]